MKILNLYAGIGGNRKLWGNGHDITAIELDESIAKCYKHNFPQDNIIITDAHKYLIKHFEEYDFIWSSPPCPTHSKARFMGYKATNPVYPDMKLYEEIIFLKHHFKGLWVVENVDPYYDVLIPPSKKLGRHLFWSNFKITGFNINGTAKEHIQEITTEAFQERIGLDIEGFSFNQRKDKIMRNCVLPQLGKHILDCALNKYTHTHQKQTILF